MSVCRFTMGDNLYPKMRSSARRAICAFTDDSLSVVGCFKADRIAGLVIS